MTTRLQQQRSDKHTASHLFMKMFMLLALMVGSVGSAWASVLWTGGPKVTLISNTTYVEDGLTYAELYGFSNDVTNDFGGLKFYKMNADDAYVKIQFINGSAKYRFMAGDVLSVLVGTPDNNRMVGFKIKDNTRGNAAEATISNTSTTLQYTLKAEDINDDGTITIYRAGGTGYACRYREFSVRCVRYGNDIFVSSNDTNLGSASFVVTSASESNVSSNTPVVAASVSTGASITFTATPADGKLLWNWDINGSPDYGKGTSFTTSVDGGMTVKANFTNGLHLRAYTNDASLGTVNIQRGSISGTDLHVTPYPGSVKYIATETGGTFVGWYSDEARTQLVSDQKEYNTPTGDAQITFNDYTLYAKFDAKSFNGTIGATDNSTKFKGDFSPYYDIPVGQERTFTFKNYGDGATRYDNWSLQVNDNNKNEIVLINTTQQAWVNGTALATPTMRLKDGNYIKELSDDDWNEFNAAMKDAEVTVRVINSGSAVYMYAFIKGSNGKEYVYVCTHEISSQTVNVRFTVEKAHLTDFASTEKKTAVKQLVGYNISPKEESGSVTIYNIAGDVIERNSELYEGTPLVYVASPNAGYLFKEWGGNGITANPRYLISNVGQTTTPYATFVLISGMEFAKTADVYNFSGNYTQTISGVTDYYIKEILGKLKSCNVRVDANGVVTGLPSYDQNYGGTVTVAARVNGSDVASYILTVPYKKYTWNLYREGVQTSDLDNIQALTNDHYTMGDYLLGAANPGAASDVPAEATIPNEGTTFPKKYIIDNPSDALQTHIKRLLNWQNKQVAGLADTDPHKHWDYTFKTLQHVDHISTKPIEYANEPLFAYKQVVNGNNARIVKETQGLIFNTAPLGFGINDSYNTTGQNHREQDRSVLLKFGGTLTIPHVTKGHYVKIHWYRHSDNAGDMFSVTNARDLDGNDINPDHIIRFTGSHYQNNSGWRGYTILQAKETGDMTITIQRNCWTEFYTIEVTDEYETELKVIYGNLYENNTAGWGGPTSTGYGEGDYMNMHDQVVSVVRDSRNTDWLDPSSLATSGWIDAKHTGTSDELATTGSNRFGANPLIYISSYPGLSYGWNGWNLDVTVTPVAEDAGKLSIGTKKDLWTKLGNNICYRMTALTNFRGTGTAHVVVRTKSGSVDGSTSYTLDMQEAYFPVGEYHGQNYPYTWDFRQYNMQGGKVSNTYDYTTNRMERSTSQSYGAWSSVVSGGVYYRKMQTYASVPATIPFQKEHNKGSYNKFIFADGSQFPWNAGSGADEVRETDGLRMNLTDGLTKSNNYKNETVLVTGNDITVPGSITVPEVGKDMYVFVRSSSRPTVTINGVAVSETRNNSEYVNFYTDQTWVNMVDGDIPSNVYVYKQTENGYMDVVIYPNAPVEAIGVTNYFKPMTIAPGESRSTWVTESRNERIDYSNTGLFTKHDLQAYVAKSVKEYTTADQENGILNFTSVKVVPSSSESNELRGLVLYDDIHGASGTTPRPLVPLFVPACNIPNDNISGNKLVDRITGAEIQATDGNYLRYVLTNQVFNNRDLQGSPYTAEEGINFYILRETGWARNNSCYLEFNKSNMPAAQGAAMAKVRKLYIVVDDDVDWDDTAVEEVEMDEKQIIDSGIYTLTGRKLNELPTEKGIYIMNGKKVLVK